MVGSLRGSGGGVRGGRGGGGGRVIVTNRERGDNVLGALAFLETGRQAGRENEQRRGERF